MIVVTGTKRSGTSMWMQILNAAGFTPFGEAYPLRWNENFGELNPEGFYESLLRNGIYYATNPHPQTGQYFLPEQVEKHAVKVFIPGVVRTERAYLGRVLTTVRQFREYEASANRLYAIEDKKRLPEEIPPSLPSALEWWRDNFAIIRDVGVRGYPAHFQSYDSLLKDPEKAVRAVLSWIGEGDVKEAVAAVKTELRTFERPEGGTAISDEYAEVFDDLYDHIDQQKALEPSFLKKLNAIQVRLAPVFAEQIRAMDAHLRSQGRLASGVTAAVTAPA